MALREPSRLYEVLKQKNAPVGRCARISLADLVNCKEFTM